MAGGMPVAFAQDFLVLKTISTGALSLDPECIFMRSRNRQTFPEISELHKYFVVCTV